MYVHIAQIFLQPYLFDELLIFFCPEKSAWV